MSCRHDLAGGTCARCYPATGKIQPGPEDDYEDNMDGPGAVTSITAKRDAEIDRRIMARAEHLTDGGKER